MCSGLVYIGASSRLIQRMHEQVVMLRSNRHYNERLQSDWNEFGADCFTVFPLEMVENAAALYDREKQWIRKCAESGVYNDTHAVRAKHLSAFENIADKITEFPELTGCAKSYAFKAPNGEIFRVRGLKLLAKAYDLNESHLSKLARGTLLQHKGWTPWNDNQTV